MPNCLCAHGYIVLVFISWAAKWKSQNNIRVSAWTACQNSADIIIFLKRHDGLINVDQRTIFAHRFRASTVSHTICLHSSNDVTIDCVIHYRLRNQTHARVRRASLYFKWLQSMCAVIMTFAIQYVPQKMNGQKGRKIVYSCFHKEWMTQLFWYGYWCR